MKIGSIIKRAGSYLLFVVGFLAYVMTWQVELLSPLGGLFVMVISLSGAIFMWLDAEKSVRIGDKQDAGRAKTDL